MQARIRRLAFLLVAAPLLACPEGGTDPEPQGGGELRVFGAAGESVAAGSTYAPAQGDAPLLGSAFFSLEVKNPRTSELVLNDVALEPVGGTLPAEWALNQGSGPERKPWAVNDQVLGPEQTLTLGLFFAPVASGPRPIRVTLTYDGSKTFAFTVEARGRDNATLSPVATSGLERILGKKTASSLVGAMVADADGDQYLSLNANEWSDSFSENVAVARVKKDGRLGWAKEWAEQYEQLSPDPGQNGEAGGAAESMALGPDGHLYLVGRRSQTSANSAFQAFVLKVKKEDGALVWARGLTRGASPVPSNASRSLEAYAVDASLADRVVVTGKVADSEGVLLAAIKKADGSLIWAKEIDVFEGEAERGQAIAVDAAGNAYVGGSGSGTGLLLKVAGVSGAAPAVEWVHELSMDAGGNVNSLALDTAGNLYAALDYRGAATRFAAARFAPDGAVGWARVWDAGNGMDRNNPHVIRVSGEQVFVGGRIGFEPFDTQMGDGFVMSLSTAGAWRWGAFYFTGKGAERMAEHRVKGLAIAGGELLVLQQGHPGPGNSEHYAGFWYQANDATQDFPAGTGAGRLADLPLQTGSRTADATLAPLLTGTLHELSLGSLWRNAPSDVALEEASERKGNDGRTHALLQRVRLAGQ